MRKFSSYGPIDTHAHYYAPRKDLIQQAFTQVVGEEPERGGHYITVWAPRQTGKTWVMQQVLFSLQHEKQYEHFDVAKINLQSLEGARDTSSVSNRQKYEVLYTDEETGVKVLPMFVETGK